MEIELKTEDGFISQECPACEMIFKVEPGKGSSKPVSFCPYCAHEGHDCWWTKEQAEYLGSIAANKLIKPELDKLARGFNRQSGGFLSIKGKSSVSPLLPVPDEPAQGWPVIAFACCSERIRLNPSPPQKACYCPVCGTVSEG